MRQWLGFLLAIASGAVLAQPVLDLQGPANDLAFKREAVETFAARAYRARLAELSAHNQLDNDPALLARLRALIGRIGDAADIEDPASGPVNWELHTCRGCGESAAAMAGGKLLVGEEFLAAHHLSDDEAGFVLAHEAAHVLAQHTRELATVARYFVDNGLHREYWDIQRELDASFGAQLHLAFVAARQEEEADRIGFILGARAGFEPAAMMSLLAKLESSDAEGFGSHPGGKQRLKLAAAVLPAARAIKEQREGWGAGP
jgi:Zn-dependent protease with chaperone function